jgi:hypothetical protein
MNVLIARMSAGYEEMKLEPEEFIRIRKLFPKPAEEIDFSTPARISD